MSGFSTDDTCESHLKKKESEQNCLFMESSVDDWMLRPIRVFGLCVALWGLYKWAEVVEPWAARVILVVLLGVVLGVIGGLTESGASWVSYHAGGLAAKVFSSTKAIEWQRITFVEVARVGSVGDSRLVIHYRAENGIIERLVVVGVPEKQADIFVRFAASRVCLAQPHLHPGQWVKLRTLSDVSKEQWYGIGVAIFCGINLDLLTSQLRGLGLGIAMVGVMLAVRHLVQSVYPTSFAGSLVDLVEDGKALSWYKRIRYGAYLRWVNEITHVYRIRENRQMLQATEWVCSGAAWGRFGARRRATWEGIFSRSSGWGIGFKFAYRYFGFV